MSVGKKNKLAEQCTKDMRGEHAERREKERREEKSDEERRATRREEDDKQRSFHPKSHSRELPMRKGKWKERQL